MSYAAAVVLFPLLLWLLSGGCGLLVERLCGGTLPALLVLPVGFAALIVVSQFTTWVGGLAPLTPLILAALALLGIALRRESLAERWRHRERSWRWGMGAMLLAYLLVAAPEIVAGRPTFSGYLLDTTGAIQIAGAERLLHHAHNFSTGVPAYGTAMTDYFGKGYPSGAHSVLASVGWLSGESLIWLYSIYQALELSLLALVLTYLAGRAGLRPLAAAVTGTVASVPALLYAYALMGSIKEITALPMLMLMGALLVCARELKGRFGLRAVLPFGLAAAAALDSIGIAAAAWVGLFGVGALLVAVPIRTSRDIRPLLVGGAGLVLATAVCGLPTLGPLRETLTLAEGVSSSNSAAVADPGNLLRPLKFIQTLGVWLGETHRLEPRYLNQTYVLMGVVVVCVALGLLYLLRRRAWSILAVVGASIIAWAVLHSRGTTWTDAKLLVILSPMVMFLALTGAFGLARSRAAEGLVLAGVVIFGVLASDGLLYHGTNLAPTARYEELGAIGSRFGGQGPTLTPDFDEYSLYLLRNMEVDIPGVPYAGEFDFVPGVGKQYGRSYDLDELTLPTVERFKTIVMRRSPAWSRPPGNFHLVWQASYYTVWQRDSPSPLEHVGLGEGGWQPVAKPSCPPVRLLAKRARSAHTDLVYTPRQPNVQVDLAATVRSPNTDLVTDLEGRPEIGFGGPARVEGSVTVTAPGLYTLWLGGSVDRPLRVYVDGHLVGAPTQQSGDDGTTIHVGTLHLSAGRHQVALVRGGGDLSPDDIGSTVIDGIVFEPEGAALPPVRSIAPADWRSLCGRYLDWIEVG